MDAADNVDARRQLAAFMGEVLRDGRSEVWDTRRLCGTVRGTDGREVCSITIVADAD